MFYNSIFFFNYRPNNMISHTVHQVCPHQDIVMNDTYCKNLYDIYKNVDIYLAFLYNINYTTLCMIILIKQEVESTKAETLLLPNIITGNFTLLPT